MALDTYDPKAVAMVFDGQIIDGFADGTFVEVERNSDTWTLQMGADGDATRSKSNDRSGQIRFTLRQNAPANAVLSAAAQRDELNNTGLTSSTVVDANSGDIHSAPTSWVKKPAAAPYAKEAGDRQWIVETDELDTTFGTV